jgi:hypothetical protein
MSWNARQRQKYEEIIQMNRIAVLDYNYPGN